MRFLFSFKVYENHKFIINYVLFRVADQLIEGVSNNAPLLFVLSR